MAKKEIYVVSCREYDNDSGCKCAFEPIIAFDNEDDAKKYAEQYDVYDYDAIDYVNNTTQQISSTVDKISEFARNKRSEYIGNLAQVTFNAYQNAQTEEELEQARKLESLLDIMIMEAKYKATLKVKEK